MPEAEKESRGPNTAKTLTDEHKELVKETWKLAAKPEVQAGQKLFRR